MNNYRPISKLSALAKDLETLVCELVANDILSNFQSGFRKRHSITTAALKVVNDNFGFLDNRQH